MTEQPWTDEEERIAPPKRSVLVLLRSLITMTSNPVSAIVDETADAILALQPTSTVRDGWKPVPPKPTEEMINAFNDALKVGDVELELNAKIIERFAREHNRTLEEMRALVESLLLPASPPVPETRDELAVPQFLATDHARCATPTATHDTKSPGGETAAQEIAALKAEIERLTPKPSEYDHLASVVYRTDPLTPADYDEAIQALESAKTALTEGDSMGCRVCADSGHGANQCHHNPLLLARKWAAASRFWQCWHCGYIATTDEEGRAHFGESEECKAACLSSPASPIPGETNMMDTLRRARDFDERREELKNAYVAGATKMAEYAVLSQDDLDEGGYDYAESVLHPIPTPPPTGPRE